MKRAINLAALFVVVACASTTIEVPQNRYGLRVVPDIATYERLARIDPAKRLVDLASLRIPLDIRYATANNFMKKPLYPVAKAHLRGRHVELGAGAEVDEREVDGGAAIVA